jgi:hypothetical protein
MRIPPTGSVSLTSSPEKSLAEKLAPDISEHATSYDVVHGGKSKALLVKCSTKSKYLTTIVELYTRSIPCLTRHISSATATFTTLSGQL